MTVRCFIGWDSREGLAYDVLAHSIWRHASVPVSITPLRLDQLPMYRARDPLQSTDFAFSRFLVPALCNFQGWSIFCDSDMLCRDDIAKLWEMRDDRYAVMVVKHNHQPLERIKMDGQYQTTYYRKNWSSLILFNNSACSELTVHRVNTEPGLYLHQFKWLEDSQIGDLPVEWNYLVGYSDKAIAPKMIHYTSGGPWFRGYEGCEYSTAWFEERERLFTGQ